METKSARNQEEKRQDGDGGEEYRVHLHLCGSLGAAEVCAKGFEPLPEIEWNVCLRSSQNTANRWLLDARASLDLLLSLSGINCELE